MLLQETGEGRGSWGEFLGSGAQPRSRSGKNVAEGISEGLVPDPEAEAGLTGVRWSGTAGPGGEGCPLQATTSLSAFSSVPARSLCGPGYKETVGKTLHSLLMNEHL